MAAASAASLTPASLLAMPKLRPIGSDGVLASVERSRSLEGIAHQGQNRGKREYMRSLLTTTPMGTLGTEWSKKFADNLPGNLPPGLQNLLASRSAAALVPVSPTVGSLKHAASSSALVRRRNFSGNRASDPMGHSDQSGKSEDDSASTATLFAQAEQRCIAYLAESGRTANIPRSQGKIVVDPAASGDDLGPDQLDLREILATATSPTPLAPAPTAVSESLLSDAKVMEVLRTARPCTSFTDADLTYLLQTSRRRLLPKYAAALREGTPGSVAFIVLRGQLQKARSRIERQHKVKAFTDAGTDQPPPSDSDSTTIIGPGDVFGEVSALEPSVLRQVSIITLETTELLEVSAHQLKAVGLGRLAKATAERVRKGLKETFVEGALHNVNFFSSLPDLTLRQLGSLLQMRFIAKGDYLFRQGELGAEMFIILWGHVEVWRQQKRNTPKVLLKEYTGTSTYPWLGEIFQWVSDHGRAGDAKAAEDTVSLTLNVADVPQFMLLVPGFRALSMSAAQGFTVKTRKVVKDDDDNIMYEKKQKERPLKYAAKWVRIVGQLLGVQGGWKAATAAKIQEMQKMRENNLEWVHEVIEQQSKESVVPIAEGPSAEQIAKEAERAKWRNHWQEKASASTFGDCRTLGEAAKRGWRMQQTAKQQVRAEALRIAAATPGGIKENSADPWQAGIVATGFDKRE